MSPSIHQTVRRLHHAETALRHLWTWLNGTGYRPERHYMRGGRGGAGTPFAAR